MSLLDKGRDPGIIIIIIINKLVKYQTISENQKYKNFDTITRDVSKEIPHMCPEKVSLICSQTAFSRGNMVMT